MRPPLPPPARGSLIFSLRALVVLAFALVMMRLRIATVPASEASDRIVRAWAARVLRWSGCHVTVHGAEHLTGSCALFVANHASALDSVVLMASLAAPFRFVVNHAAATRPLLGAAISKAGHLVVDRRSAASRAACARLMIAALRHGTSLVVYPEGTRAVGAMLPFQAVPFRVAQAAGRQVVPIAIEGTGQILPRRFWLLSRVPVTVTVLPPIESGPGMTAMALRDEAASAIAARLNRSLPPAT